MRNHHRMPGRWLLLGALASPAFDLAFLGSYLRARLRVPRGDGP